MTGTRAQRALATRRRMVQAAYELFCANGYLGTTISAVAAKAGVAVPTIYYTFSTKAALLSEALGSAIVGIDRWREPPSDPDMAELLTWHQWWSDFQAAPTSADALRICVEHGTRIHQRVAPLIPAMRGSVGDPDAAGFLELNEQRRIESLRELLEVVARKRPGLRPELTITAATDIFAALFSPDVYHGLSVRGWPHDRCTHFFQQLLASQLLAHRPTSRATSSTQPSQ
jgi:AcrR family transcriptional regulator